MRNGIEKIDKREWYRLGGFRNSALFRRGRGGSWGYFIDHTHPKAPDGPSPWLTD